MKAILFVLLGAFSAYGAPSGLDPLPTGVVIPKFHGRTLPVGLLPDTDNPKMIHVKPLEGEFVSQGVVKSPLTDCDLVKQELKISEISAEARVNLANLLKQAQIEYAKNQKDYKDLVKKFEEYTALREPISQRVTDAETEKSERLSETKELMNQAEATRELIAIESDPNKLVKLEAQLKKQEAEIEKKKREFVAAGKAVREARTVLSDLDVKLAAVSGKKRGMEKTLLVQTEELTRIQTQLEALQVASEAVLMKYSERVGGYTTFTSEFAPASYIQALKEANPDYQFQYVPSVTAVVDTTIPENITPGSPLERSLGTLILDAKWSDPERARSEKKFTKFLISANEKVTDPVALAQRRMSELESSLEGTKFLSLKLSILGYCALREPAALSTQFVGGAADTFKLAMYYTYPVNYAVRIQGKYNSYATLYELHKITSSSSWFGLSKSQKREHVRNLSTSRNIDVKVEPIGYQMTPQESMTLAEKVKEQLVYFAVEPFLEKKGASERVTAPEPGELGATSVAKRLVLIPNPYAFWGGVVLGALGEMFGSSSSESVERISEQTWVNINYETGFSFLHAGDITIGDLKRAELIKQ